jgi:hypothetical protein
MDDTSVGSEVGSVATETLVGGDTGAEAVEFLLTSLSTAGATGEETTPPVTCLTVGMDVGALGGAVGETGDKVGGLVGI